MSENFIDRTRPEYYFACFPKVVIFEDIPVAAQFVWLSVQLGDWEADSELGYVQFRRCFGYDRAETWHAGVLRKAADFLVEHIERMQEERDRIKDLERTATACLADQVSTPMTEDKDLCQEEIGEPDVENDPTPSAVRKGKAKAASSE
jgi:hypothetical protein